MTDDPLSGAAPPIDAPAPARPGRPPATSVQELEAVALRLFAQQGYAATTVEEIASAAGVNKRTFFRYFKAKGDVVWNEFDAEVELIRTELARVADEPNTMAAIRTAVINASQYTPEGAENLHARMRLLRSEPDLLARLALHHQDWAREVSKFVAARVGQEPDGLYPEAVGRAVLATCQAAYERWVARGEPHYTTFLHAALTALEAGFPEDAADIEPH